MKLKDFVNKKVNSRNHQISLDIKKRKLAKFDMDVDEFLNMEMSKIKKGDFY